MTIFEDMFPESAKLSHYELQEIEAMISQAIERGRVRELPIPRNSMVGPLIRWFVEPESGSIFALTYFGERSSASWRKVNLADRSETLLPIQ
jgi:hypothetical protein